VAQLGSSPVSDKICLQFVQIFNGANAMPTRQDETGFSGDFDTTGRKADCVFITDDSGATMPINGTETYLYIRAF
jgi:hypothetical protein